VKTNPEIEAKNRSSITRTCPVTYSNSKAIHSTKWALKNRQTSPLRYQTSSERRKQQFA
jgi:hypothetical protein